MGQNESSNAFIGCAKIKREELEAKVQELNERCSECFDQNQLNMIFAVKYYEHKDPWQFSVRIFCFTVLDGKAYRKTYNLYQFMKFYRSFSHILEASQISSAVGQQHTDPTRDEDFMRISIFDESCCVDDGQCIVCFDSRPDAVLPCAHAYCSKCIDNFQRINQRCCPLCRLPLQGDDAWVVAEKPSKESINLYLVESSLQSTPGRGEQQGSSGQ